MVTRRSYCFFCFSRVARRFMATSIVDWCSGRALDKSEGQAPSPDNRAGII